MQTIQTPTSHMKVMNRHNGKLAAVKESRISDYGFRNFDITKADDNYTLSITEYDLRDHWYSISDDAYTLLMHLSDTTTQFWGNDVGFVPSPIFAWLCESMPDKITKQLIVQNQEVIASEYAGIEGDSIEIALRVAEAPHTPSEQLGEVVVIGESGEWPDGDENE